MDQDSDKDGRIARIVEFTVRYDKFRGVVVEKFTSGNNEYFFKSHDEPITRHCAQMQKIVRLADVKRTKKISVDITEFEFEYFRNSKATFKGCPLNSINHQIQKVCDLYVNKEVGMIKRSTTVAQNKPQKILDHNSKILTRMQEAEKHFQEQRARRIHELFGPKNPAAPGGPTASGSGTEGQSSLAHRVPVAAVSPRSAQFSAAPENDSEMLSDDDL